jgi:hypothetical protein
MGKLALAVFLMPAGFGTVDVGQKNPPPSIRLPIVCEKKPKGSGLTGAFE